MKHHDEDSFPVPRGSDIDFGLFAPPAPTRLAGVGDRPTSLAAADRIAPHLSDLQRLVLHAFRELGPMTDYELEQLERFRAGNYSPSTIRKRRGELVRAALLEECGEKLSGVIGRSKMTIHAARRIG